MSPFGKAIHLLPLILGALTLLGVPWLWSSQARRTLGDPAVITGWWLFGVFVLLGAFNARKKLSVLPLGRASAWLRLHVAGGFLAIALFWLHTRSLWPTGAHRQALAGAFYLLSASGIVGWLLQRTYPRQLADTGLEIIYEHIPAEIARLRNAADQLVLDTTRDAGNDTLTRHYMETLHWFFRRPRFFVNHAFFGGKHARAWVRQQCGVVRPYLGAVERERLERLAALAEEKLQIDFHHAAQSIMKRWLLVHLPLAAVTTILVVWHVLLVHAYGR